LRLLSLLIISLCIFANSQVSAQNGWTRKAKEGYVQLTASSFSSSDYYSLSGKLLDQGSGTFNSLALSMYADFGIVDRLTAVANVPIIVLNNFSSTETVSGVGNIRLGLKYRLLKNFPLSFQAEAEIPTNDGINIANSKKPDSFGTFNQINLPTSDGEFNFWTTLVASQSTSDGKSYGTLHTSLNLRTEGFSNQIQAGVEVGHKLFDKLFLIGTLTIQETLAKKDIAGFPSFLYGEGTTFTRYKIMAMYDIIKGWKGVISYARFSDFLIAEKNIYSGPIFSFGLALEY